MRQGDRVLLGDPIAGVLAGAREKLDAGDLAGAVKALDGLAGPAGAAMKPWVDQARRAPGRTRGDRQHGGGGLMRTALTLFVVALICVTLAWWLSLLPGTVSATIAGTTFEAPASVAAALGIALFLVLYAWMRFLGWLVRLPRHGRRWRRDRARERGDLAVNRTLIALAANDAGAARREAERSRRLLGDTPVTLLLAAQAGRQAGREEEVEAAFRQLADRSDGRLLGLRGLLRLAVQRQDWKEATRLAGEAERAHPGAAWLRDERRYMAVQTGHWSEALRLAGPDQKPALALAAAEHEPNQGRALDYLKQAFDADQGLAPAAVAYAHRLREMGRDRAAQDVLRRAWSVRPHPSLADEYPGAHH